MKRLMLIGLMFLTADIYACSCEDVGILRGQRGADFVFVGQVVKINEVVTEEEFTGNTSKITYRRFEFVFKLIAIYKGKSTIPSRDTITIVTTGGGADCGNIFYQDEKYLVYAYKYGKKLRIGLEDQSVDEFITTSECTRTKLVNLMTFFERMVLLLT